MDFINNAILYVINMIHGYVGSYGWSIVLITVLIRVLLWPMNNSQTRSMRKMQELQPKMKSIQDRYKDEPQKMQEAMMKFYAENKFNPLAGCFPMLIQLPIFIGLFGALNSPAFLAASVDENFYFVDKLYDTLHSHAGEPLDGVYSVKEKDKFMTDKTAYLIMKDGTKREMKIKDVNKAIDVSPQPILPGEPMMLTLNMKQLGIEDEGYYKERLSGVELFVVNTATKELENLHFKNMDGELREEFKTIPGEQVWRIDVLILIGLYGMMTLLYQKTMEMGKPKPVAKAGDEQAQMQQKMMKLLPLMFIVMLIFIPMPAGVMLYLVVTTALMFIQTLIVNLGEMKKEKPEQPASQVVDIEAK